MRGWTCFRLVGLVLFVFEAAWFAAAAESTPTNLLAEEVYVWQRSWGEPLRAALREHGSAFSRIVALKAEVSWRDGRPQVVTVPVDYAALRASDTQVGLALRFGVFRGPFQPDSDTTRMLAGLASQIVAEALTNGLEVSELQLDFDCPESKLDGYGVWTGAIRHKIGRVPLTITALPSWLDAREFQPLVSSVDGYVLQVHSLERPTGSNTLFSLCDPVRARNAVAKAARLGRPFRVALPTYGYLVAFNEKGKFIGLSAEGPSRSWPAGIVIREVRSDPQQMASLIQGWVTNRPGPMQGIIWYRMPTSADDLNWHWPTLGAIIDLRSPRESVRVESRRVETGLVEISLVNDGELDISSRLAVEVRWSREGGARLLAADGVRGFEVVDQDESTLRFKSQLMRLPAGETRVTGWLRFNQDREVQVEWKRL